MAKDSRAKYQNYKQRLQNKDNKIYKSLYK